MFRAAVLRHFALTGRAPEIAELAALSGQTSDAVRADLHALADSHAIVLQPGTDRVWMAMPFSNVPTAVRVRAQRADGTAGAWWANCAWDALGIPAMFAGAGLDSARGEMAITTTCPDCERPIVLSVRADWSPPAAVVREGPPAPVVHFAVGASHWWDDIGFT